MESIALTAALFSSLLLEIISVCVAILAAATSATVAGELGSSLQLDLVPSAAAAINDDAESSSSNNEASNASNSHVVFLPVVLCNVFGIGLKSKFL